ncbi:hypothetical protein, partial [Fischerella muscicola]
PPALPATLKTAYDVYKVVSILISIYSITSKLKEVVDAAIQENIAQNIEAVKKLFTENGMKISPNDCQQVNEKSLGTAIKGIGKYSQFLSGFGMIQRGLLEPEELKKDLENMSWDDFTKHAGNTLKILDPSTFSSVISSVCEISLIIVDADFQKLTIFNTNSDHSWIVNNDGVVRSKYGKLWQEDRYAGWHLFGHPCGIGLGSEEHLKPNDYLEIDGPDGKYALIYQTDGNLVLYKNTGDSPETLWSTNTSGKSAGEARMQADGNFVVYTQSREVAWALFPEMPSGHENSTLVLDPYGNIGYKQNNQDIVFTVNKKPSFTEAAGNAVNSAAEAAGNAVNSVASTIGSWFQ